MNRPIIISASLVVLTLTVGVSHAAPEEYFEHIGIWERLPDARYSTIKDLYSGRSQPPGRSLILVLSGLSITAVDGDSVRLTRKFLAPWIKPGTAYFGYSAYLQLPGTYEFEVTSWKRRYSNRLHAIGLGALEEHATYTLQVVLDAGQTYVLSSIWNDGEVGIISPSQVCLQGQADDARYCALRPRESGDVFAMDENHGVIVVGITRRITETVYMINLDCDWRPSDLGPGLNRRSSATRLRDVCWVAFEPVDSRGYIVESVDAGVWQWWGFTGELGFLPLIETLTFDVEPGKVNYVGHFEVSYENGTLSGFGVSDRFSLFEPILRAGFGDSEIANNAVEY